RNRFTAGVRRVDGSVEDLFAFGSAVGTPLLGNAGGIVATRSAYGKGEVVAVTAPELFSNAAIARGDNARFAYDVVAGHGPAAFDEYVHGYNDQATFWQVLPVPVKVACFAVGAIVLAALAGANLPFAPPIPLEPPDERDTSEYLRAMGALMRRARAGREAVAIFAADARRHLRGSAGAAHVAEFQALEALPHPPDAAVLRAARLDFQVRKELR
ncbi:MAG TPA: DUF4350 domain-containing protein, partial [Candidatus Acidoferrales bacterium]|nr:DUF4350 domain-containing protein [Candidatus Acidoferrales bacterium]